MKKFKISMLGLMFLLAVAMMTGCRSRDNRNTTQPVSPSAESTSMEADTSGNEGDGSWAEESTGVLDRLMDDVERGADDLMDGIGAGGSAAADEGTR